MPDEPEVLESDDALQEEEQEEVHAPFLYVLWDGLIHTVLATIYFLVISAIAIAVDLVLHWVEARKVVEIYKLSRIIHWEVEFMAYSLATVDTFLFVRMLTKPGIEWIVRFVRRDD